MAHQPKLNFWLTSAVTEYDRRRSVLADYNTYALPQYLAGVTRILGHVRNGKSVRDAVSNVFSGSLQTFVLKWLTKQGCIMEAAPVKQVPVQMYENTIRRFADVIRESKCTKKR